ncbi:MAG TPA: lysylphosphatidylglycerol synthase transmembrane domain-containing protein, partial [Verrucomicrobiae bacterium]|nr:lysylphosphatidylglycerol synthase transmembrane domain-containing protein [Verrucomicrobiae bacterium]
MPTPKPKGSGINTAFQRLWRSLPVALSYVVAGACLFWIFHDVNWHDLLHSMERIVWWRLLPVAVLDIASYLIVAYEWQLLLRPAGRLGFIDASRAVFAGRFANDVLPVQLGYLVRIFLASRAMGERVSVVVPSLLLERLLDGWWLGVGILLLTFYTPLPSSIIRARNILGGVVVAGLLVMVFLAFKRRKPNHSTRQPGHVRRPVEVIRGFLHRVIEGMSDIARSHVLPAVVLLAAVKLLVQGFAYFAVLWAYGLEVSVWTGLAVFLIAYLGITVPSTPASAGVFQFFSVLGLELFGIEKTTASGVSLVAFVVLTAPLAATGFYAVATSGLT